MLGHPRRVQEIEGVYALYLSRADFEWGFFRIELRSRCWFQFFLVVVLLQVEIGNLTLLRRYDAAKQNVEGVDVRHTRSRRGAVVECPQSFNA